MSVMENFIMSLIRSKKIEDSFKQSIEIERNINKILDVNNDLTICEEDKKLLMNSISKDN